MNTIARFSLRQDMLLKVLKDIKAEYPTRKADQRQDLYTHIIITAAAGQVTFAMPLSAVKVEPVTISGRVDIAGVTVIHYKTLMDVTKLTSKGERMDFIATEYAAGESNGSGYTFSEAGTEVVLTADLTRTRFRTALIGSSLAPIYPVEELAEDLPVELASTPNAGYAPVVLETNNDTPISIEISKPKQRRPRPLSRRERLALKAQLLGYLNARDARWANAPPILRSHPLLSMT